MTNKYIDRRSPTPSGDISRDINEVIDYLAYLNEQTNFILSGIYKNAASSQSGVQVGQGAACSGCEITNKDKTDIANMVANSVGEIKFTISNNDKTDIANMVSDSISEIVTDNLSPMESGNW